MVHPLQKNLLPEGLSLPLAAFIETTTDFCSAPLEKPPLCRTQQMRIAWGSNLKTGTVVKTPAENFFSAD